MINTATIINLNCFFCIIFWSVMLAVKNIEISIQKVLLWGGDNPFWGVRLLFNCNIPSFYHHIIIMSLYHCIIMLQSFDANSMIIL